MLTIVEADDNINLAARKSGRFLIKQNSKAISAGEMELYFLGIEDISHDSKNDNG
jgi:hypothetical protein